MNGDWNVFLVRAPGFPWSLQCMEGELARPSYLSVGYHGMEHYVAYSMCR